MQACLCIASVCRLHLEDLISTKQKIKDLERDCNGSICKI